MGTWHKREQEAFHRRGGSELALEGCVGVDHLEEGRHSKDRLNVLKFMVKDSGFCPGCASGAETQSPHLSKGRLTSHWPLRQLCSPSLWDSQHWGGVSLEAIPSLSLPHPTWSHSFTYHTYPHTPLPCRPLQMPHSDLPWPPQPLQGIANRHLQAISCGQNTTLCLSRMSSVQFNSVAQSCPTLCNPMDCSTPGLPVLHQLLEFTQTHVRSR